MSRESQKKHRRENRRIARQNKYAELDSFNSFGVQDPTPAEAIRNLRNGGK